MTPSERQAAVTQFNELHAARARELAALITSENGTPSWFTSAVQAGVATENDTLVQVARDTAWEEPFPAGEHHTTVVRREPVGVVAAVVPWNTPHQSALIKIIPALLAGCTIVLKPLPETALDGVLLGEILTEAGFPDGVINVLPAGRPVSEYLISHPGIDMIAFTGSSAAGRRITSVAAERLTRVSLELGGKSAAIILDDADLDTTVAGLKLNSLSNNGEACNSHTRLLAPRSRYAEITGALEAMVGRLTVGNPALPATFIGPMVSAGQRERVQSYIRTGVREGARLATGGPGDVRCPGLENGFYVHPTLFADVDNSMVIAQEEIFGPVLRVIPCTDQEDAIRIANDSRYGLSGGVGAPIANARWRSPAASAQGWSRSTAPGAAPTPPTEGSRPAASVARAERMVWTIKPRSSSFSVAEGVKKQQPDVWYGESSELGGRSKPAVPRRRLSRPVSVGVSNAPTPGRTPSTASPAATSGGPPLSTPSSTSSTRSSPCVV
jgi:acyl-CoA reductase-like NAD-dependent aldehyde dehydrogenase